MQRPGARRVAACVALLGLLAFARPFASRADAPMPLAPPLAHLPLPNLRITGGFGESRSNHFHAGLDFSTGGRTGAAVRAPSGCCLERVRASGVGYGRSLYLRCENGSTIVFGHLDAYAPAIAAWVDSVQRASGQYEQDLWPPATRFCFGAGDTVAWSGESGAGGPHLHMEIRHGDFALDPLRAGLVQPGDAPPRLETLTLEPLDETSWVERNASPHTVRLGAARETLVVEGRVRAIVRSRAGLPAASGVPAWSTALEWNGDRIEARLDSISWAGEMSEQDLVLDRGRVSGSYGFILQLPGGFTPRFLLQRPDTFPRGSRSLVGSAPDSARPQRAFNARPWNGVIEVRPGDPPKSLLLAARDAQGLAVERRVWLRGPSAAERGVDTLRAGRGATAGGAAHWSVASLPAGRLRARLTGAPPGLRGVRIGAVGGDDVAAGWDGTAWSAVLVPAAGPARGGLAVRGRFADGRAWRDSLAAALWRPDADAPLAPAGFARFTLAPSALYEQGTFVTRVDAPPVAPGGLVARSEAVTIAPGRWPLRRAVPVAFALPPHTTPLGVDLYRRDESGGWSALRARWDDSARVFRAETSALGTFALLRDERAPVITLLKPAHRPAAGSYPRWQLEARVREDGSGLDASASAFEIDGVRVPSEWDGEERILRWRPARAPSPGVHRVVVRVADRAGNAAERSGSFVLDSARR